MIVQYRGELGGLIAAKRFRLYLELYRKSLIIREQSVSAVILQRKLGIGYVRAARLVDRVEGNGIVGKWHCRIS